MTARQLFEYALIELNKIQAPSLLLEDYNYFINKAVNQYINKVYNLYDINQQKSDDLRVLKSTAILFPSVNNDYSGMDLLSKTYEADLPDDYLHLLNCVLEYKVNYTYKCYNKLDSVHFGAKRLTADMFSQIINNYYMRPTYKNPYYYINNVATDLNFPIAEAPKAIPAKNIEVINSATIVYGMPASGCSLAITQNGSEKEFIFAATKGEPNEFSTKLQLVNALENEGISVILSDANIILDAPFQLGITSITVAGTGLTLENMTKETINNSLVEKKENFRYGNRSKVRLEIRYGKDNTVFTLEKVYVDYLKAPQFIRLTQEQVDEVIDNSQILEFPDYVNQEIVNELIKLLMENASDQRLQTHIPINQSIASPAQEQPQQKR